MLNEPSVKNRIISAALTLAKVRPWRELSLLDIAEAAGASLADVRQHFASKSDILVAFIKAVDDEMLRKAPKRTSTQGARDAIFEVVMSRLDVLEPYKGALRSIVDSAGPDLALARAGMCAQSWMLSAAGVDATGVQGIVRTLGLGSVYASVLRIWLEDDDPGLARTMAALDRRLRRGEQNIRALDDICGAARRVCAILPRPFGTRSAKSPTQQAAAEGAPRPDAAPGSA